MRSQFTIRDFEIHNEGRCFIIAEAGVNHNGNMDYAHRLVDIAANAGADAIKFQTFSADRLVSATARKADYQVSTTGEGTQQDMLRSLELSGDAFMELRTHCDRRRIVFLSTPFDEESADMLEAIGVRAFKIGSGDVTNRGLLEHLARKGKPIILSTGMSSLGEVEDAMSCLDSAGADSVALLQCTSSYPAPADSINLKAMTTLRTAFGVPVGYSDHTVGLPISLASVALGAALLEKHFTLDPTLPGPDHRASLAPAELEEMVLGVREIEAALGSAAKRLTEAERNTREVARRSLFARSDIPAGALIGADDLVSLRPGTGLSPMRLDLVVGRHARRTIAAGSMIELSDLQN